MIKSALLSQIVEWKRCGIIFLYVNKQITKNSFFGVGGYNLGLRH